MMIDIPEKDCETLLDLLRLEILRLADWVQRYDDMEVGEMAAAQIMNLEGVRDRLKGELARLNAPDTDPNIR